MSCAQDGALLVERLQRGSQEAASEVYQRYAQRLCQQIERRIGQHLQGRVEAGDVVQSAFRTFFRRAANGEFTIDHTCDLWHLLLTITLNKVRGQAEHHCAKKRDPRREQRIGFHVFPDDIGSEPSAAEAIALDDELESLLARLEGTEAEIVRLRLAGLRGADIAARMHCSRVTVWRKLDRVFRNCRPRD
ncbi:MAG: ECF-type sigma factor [Pirellulaceae bacterium]|nr:ECF-type sigma factor [Pirellulaceae bacterium]